MDRFQTFIEDNNLPKYRYKQIANAIYVELVSSYIDISTIPKELKGSLETTVPFNLLSKEKILESKNKSTIKVLFHVERLNKSIETVLMRHKDGRNTVCVSCMVGCPVGCTFCATGQMGFGGNLTSDEIVEQVIYFEKFLRKSYEGEDVSNVVFMGMGEPMLNLREVKNAIEILNDYMGLGKRRITVSTSGYVPQLHDLISWGYRGRIAVSLHAPNQELRLKLMPTVAKVYPLDQLMKALKKFELLTNKRITYEYILIDEVNDKEEHAVELAELLQGRLAHVNLIPFNRIQGSKYRRSSEANVEKFQKVLKKYGILNTVRVTMGGDVNAACGQLATGNK